LALRHHHALSQHHPASRTNHVAGDSVHGAASRLDGRWKTHWPWSCVPTSRIRDLGANISTFASSAPCTDIGFNYFVFQGRQPKNTAAILVFSGPLRPPGIYAGAFLEGRISEGPQLDNFRQEVRRQGAVPFLPTPLS